MKKYKVGIVGCGFIGTKRAKTLHDHTLLIVADTNIERARTLSQAHACRFTTEYTEVTRSDVDIVIVSTSNDMLIPVALDAVKHGKHVLIEKPGARNPQEMKTLLDAVRGKNIKVKVGFNHRYHPAMLKAKELLKKDSVGDIMFIRARYGHGGRIGYDTEWRAKKDISGGGELLDQGCHLIDLGNMFLGEFADAVGFTPTYFWNMDVEDNGFALLRTAQGQIMQLHACWTEWKNLFSFEIMCRNAKIEISGLGRSYGVETLTFYQMKPEMGPPDKEVFSFPEEDRSWDLEFEDFVMHIQENKPLSDLHDALHCITLIYDIYAQNKR
ncbi:MAG: Gfo/Idh/MocA family oxidoreductase [archaeon]